MISRCAATHVHNTMMLIVKTELDNSKDENGWCMSSMYIYVITCVHESNMHSKTSNVNFLTVCFIPAMLFGTSDFLHHVTSLSVYLTLALGHKVSRKQRLLG